MRTCVCHWGYVGVGVADRPRGAKIDLRTALIGVVEALCQLPTRNGSADSPCLSAMTKTQFLSLQLVLVGVVIVRVLCAQQLPEFAVFKRPSVCAAQVPRRPWCQE